MENKKADIRVVTARDAEQLFRVCRQAYSESFGDHWNEGGLEWYLDQVYSLKGIKSDLNNPLVVYFLVEMDGGAVGFLKLKVRSELPGYATEAGAEIEKIYFLRSFQGRGIGRQLMEVALRKAKENSSPFVWLGVIDTNLSAISFYEKTGFQKHDQTRLDLPFFKDELRGMWRMVLPLSDK